MLRRNHKEIVFECDECGAEMETGEEEFAEALRLMKGDGWKAKKDPEAENGWKHVCDDCQD